ncbi:TadE family protein [Aquipuribacter sp. SD81]|uniref:TadE family protein n=1 Tax=Aquipuribacter sp. SD81 TaxID=3127703 RepID=UPI00301AE4B8
MSIRRDRRLSGGGEADRGATTLELVVLFPVMLLLVFGILQGVFWYHARTVALAAAGSGVAVTRTEQGTSAAGRAAASDFVERAGGGEVLAGVQVQAARSATEASVTVSGRAPSLLPGLPGPPVRQTATGPVERVTTS